VIKNNEIPRNFIGKNLQRTFEDLKKSRIKRSSLLGWREQKARTRTRSKALTLQTGNCGKFSVDYNIARCWEFLKVKKKELIQELICVKTLSMKDKIRRVFLL
jgi:hypothetical protein